MKAEELMTDKIRREAEEIFPQAYGYSEDFAKALRNVYLAGATRDAWVRVSDELPEKTDDKERVHCLIWREDTGLGQAYYDFDLKVFAVQKQPTHWQFLPPAPPKPST